MDLNIILNAVLGVIIGSCLVTMLCIFALVLVAKHNSEHDMPAWQRFKIVFYHFAPFARKRAISRSYELLWSYLDNTQKWHMKYFNSFLAKGSKTGHFYLITDRYSHWGGRTRNVICFHPYNKSVMVTVICVFAPWVPKYDALLTQKIMIENDEFEFLTRANLRGLRDRFKHELAHHDGTQEITRYDGIVNTADTGSYVPMVGSFQIPGGRRY